MTSELVLDVSSYGIEKSKAEQLEKVFVPMVKKFKELEKEYIEVVSQKVITEQVCSDAKIVRNRYVKVRTGADEIHKIAKASLLIETRAIDGLRNIVKYAVIDHENSLLEVEKHFEIIEAAKLEKLREERESILLKFGDNNPGLGDLATMSEEVWFHYIANVEITYKAKIDAEKKVEIERIEKEKKQDLFDDRREKLILFFQFNIQNELTLETSLQEFIDLTKKGIRLRDEFNVEQKRIKEENENLKKKAELKRIADEKMEATRVKRNKELTPYIIFIRDYNALLNSDEKEYQKQFNDIKAGAELQWEFDRKEVEKKALREQKEREAKEKIELELKNRQEQDRKDKEAEDLRVKNETDKRRELSLAPEKERLQKWVNDMEITNIDYGKMGEESALIARIVMAKFNSFKNWAKKEIEKIK